MNFRTMDLYRNTIRPLGVNDPGGGDGISGMYDSNQLSLQVWITQNSSTSIDYTFDGQALWSSYDTVQGYTDYPNLTWWPNEASQTGTTTHSAVGVNVNNLSQSMTFPSQLVTADQNQYEVSVPQTEYQNSVEYALSQVDWGVTVANPNLSPNDLNAGDLNCYYTQTWTGLTPSFTVGYDSASMTVSPTSKENTWLLGPLNWSPNTSQTS